MPPPEPSAPQPRRAFTVSAVLAAALVAVPSLAVRRVSDPSPWLHLAVGRFLNDGRRFSLPDPWGPYVSHAYVPTQWLPSMLTAALFDRWGTAVVAWERAAGIGLLCLALLWWLCAMARPMVAAIVVAVAVYASWPGLTERPQLAALVLLVPTFAAWLRSSVDHRPRWWLVPLTWVSASTHGLWAIGLGIGGLVVGCLVVSRAVSRREATRLGALLVACLVAAAVTPVGPRLLLTPFAVGSQGRQFVTEWYPSSVRSPHVLLAVAMLGAVWLLWGQRRHRPSLTSLAVLAVATVLVFAMQRTVPVGAILAAALLAPELERLLAAHTSTAPTPMRRRHLALLAAATAVGLALAVPVAATRATSTASAPEALAPALRALPQGTRVISDGDLSGWELFVAGGRLEPVFDLRIEAYSPAHTQRFIDAMAAQPGWSQFVQGTGATVALLKVDSPLGAALREQLGWVQHGADRGYVLWERTS